jgi:hypothetical protein
MTLLRMIFAANVVVAGVVGTMSLFAPALAARTVFSGVTGPELSMRITGAFWTAIAVLSLIGLAYPVQLAPILLVQLIYKALWLMVVVAPAVIAGQSGTVPAGVAWFFLVWVVVLPLVIPWRALFG